VSRAPLRARRSDAALVVGAYVVVALAVYLDSAASPLRLAPSVPITTAGVFGVVVVAFELLGTWIATAAEVTIIYLWAALTWLAGAMAGVVVSLGAMLARVWDAVKIVWTDVLKPALVWLDDVLKRVQTWLRDTLKPIIDFVGEVKRRIQAFYDTFVKPVVDTIDFIRGVNRVLLVFHIDLLQKLDTVLQRVEHEIQAPFLWIEEKLTEVQNLVNRIMTADGLFRRLALIRSMSRYAPAWLRVAVAARNKPVSDYDAYRLQASYIPQDPGDLSEQLGAYLEGVSNDTGDVIDAAAARLTAFWTA
jgi:hypothetical protein